jgi:hypothetical protein
MTFAYKDVLALKGWLTTRGNANPAPRPEHKNY